MISIYTVDFFIAMMIIMVVPAMMIGLWSAWESRSYQPGEDFVCISLFMWTIEMVIVALVVGVHYAIFQILGV